MYYLNVSGITVRKGKILEIIQAALGLLNNLVIALNSLQYCSGETICSIWKKIWHLFKISLKKNGLQQFISIITKYILVACPQKNLPLVIVI